LNLTTPGSNTTSTKKTTRRTMTTDRDRFIDAATAALDKPTCEHDVMFGCIHCRAEWAVDAMLAELDR
jgi:hypothetical protein